MYAEKPPELSASPMEQERMVILANETATNYARAQAYIPEVSSIKRYSKPLILKSSKEAEANVDMLRNNIREGDLVYVLSGDGLLNLLIQYASDVEAPDFSIMASDAGDACNAYHGTIDSRFSNPVDIMMHGFIGPAYLLRGTVEVPDDPSESFTQVALSVMDIGAMATGAVVLDKYRNSRWRKNPETRDKFQKLLAALTLPTLRSLEVTGLGDDDPHLMMDAIAVNAGKIAKEFHFPTSLAEYGFAFNVIKDALHLPIEIQKMRSAKKPLDCHRVTANKEPITFQLTDSPRNRKARIQFDGEVRKQFLPPNSKITIDQPGFDDPTHKPAWMVFAR